MRHGLIIFADVDQLFSHARRIEEGGTLGPSNNARMRVYLRRMRSQGAGIAQDFLDMLQGRRCATTTSTSLDYSEDIERAVLRMFAAQRDPTHRRRLVMAVLRRLIALVNAGISLRDDGALRDALVRIAAMRGDISQRASPTPRSRRDYRIYQGAAHAAPGREHHARLESWLPRRRAAARRRRRRPRCSEDLALAPASVFARVEEWLRARRSLEAGDRAVGLRAPAVRAEARARRTAPSWSTGAGSIARATTASWCSRRCAGRDEIGAALRSLAGVGRDAREALALELVVLGDGLGAATPRLRGARARRARAAGCRPSG